MIMKKTMIIMILGAVVIGISVSVSAQEDEIPRIISEERAVDIQDSIVDECPTDEILVIAPSPYSEIDQDAETIEEPLISPAPEDEIMEIQILENQEHDELLDSAKSSAKVVGQKSSDSNFIVQTVIAVGTMMALLVILLALRKK